MHPSRVLELINSTRIPDRKKKFWPTHSIVFVSAGGSVLDVIQYFGMPTPEESERDHGFYPGSAYFIVANRETYTSEEEIEARIRKCQRALNRKRPKGLTGALLIDNDGNAAPSLISRIEAKLRNM